MAQGISPQTPSLWAVTAYRKDANAIKDRLGAQDRKIAALQSRFNELAFASVAFLPFNTLPAPHQNGSPTVHEKIGPFSLSK